jgi:hypothetical protein
MPQACRKMAAPFPASASLSWMPSCIALFLRDRRRDNRFLRSSEPQGAHLPRPAPSRHRRPGSPLLGPDASASQSRTSRLPQNGRRAAYRFKGISPLLSYRNGLLRTHPRHSASRERALYFAGPQMLRVSAVWGLFARERLMRARQSPPLEARGSSLQPGARPTTHVSRADPLRDDPSPQPAGIAEDGAAVAGERVAELDAVAHRLVAPREQLTKALPALLESLRPHVLPVQLHET